MGNETRRTQFATHYCACGCGERPRRWDAKYVAGHRPLKPLAERLWARVKKQPNGCWEWQGYRGPLGYGQIGLGQRVEGITSTHRAAWMVTHGDIPEGMVVRHKCDNPPCCNPEHLELGTDQDNVNDAVTRGRVARGDRLPHTVLTDDEVREIRSRYVARYGPTKRGGRSSNAQILADEYGISRVYVMQLVHGHFRKDIA